MTATSIVAVAAVIGVFRGFYTSLDMLLGASSVLLPSLWLALSLTSARSALSPIWFGLARYSLAAVCFGALFAWRPESEPLAVITGTILALLLPPALAA
ncbi:MAG: hypothetical protein P8M73_10665 [Luminiphilus sp.]|nr:hypothetical protein [Luminiphilus sp.]